MVGHQRRPLASNRKDLFLASHHIFYEFSMLRLTADLLHRRVLAGFLEDAVLEAFVLHFRNLYVFAYQEVPAEKLLTHLSDLPRDVSAQAAPRKVPSDVSASDYFDSNHWAEAVLAPSANLVVDYARAKKQVLHITKARIHQTVDPLMYTTPIDRKVWKVASIYKEVAPLVELWMSSAPKELLDTSSPFVDTANMHYELPSLNASTVFVSGPLVGAVTHQSDGSDDRQGPPTKPYIGFTGPVGPRSKPED